MAAMLWLFTLALVAPSFGQKFSLQPTAFLKLPNAQGAYVFNSGAATKAAYDHQQNFIYVVGHNADLLHVVNMTAPATPQLLSTKQFDSIREGYPDSIKVCRGGVNRDFLAVSFESRTLNERGHVRFYQLLDALTVQNPLVRLKDVVTTEAYDPRALAWSGDCTQLVVASRGMPHEINGRFEDPPADVEVLLPSFGTTVDKRSVPISESSVAAAKLRQVFTHCDSGAGATSFSTRVQDLEPGAVAVDKDDTAYVVFPSNNGIGKLDLTDPFAKMTYHDLGMKNWAGLQLDTSYEDNGINLKNRTIRSVYQPTDIRSFVVGGKTWLATADTGATRQLALTTCKFDESQVGATWIRGQQFSDGLTFAETTQLRTDLASNAELGRIRFSKMRTSNDGWDAAFQGYDYLTTYGGRGFSILDASDMSRIFDSGDDFERYFMDPNIPEQHRVMFNADVTTNTGLPQSNLFDRRSVIYGPEPTALAVTDYNGTAVVVVGAGVAGGLYVYSVAPGAAADANPIVTMQQYVRRGQPGMTWAEAYARDDDAVGEPGITDLLIIDDQGQMTVVVVSDKASALSFYNLQKAN